MNEETRSAGPASTKSSPAAKAPKPPAKPPAKTLAGNKLEGAKLAATKAVTKESKPVEVAASSPAKKGVKPKAKLVRDSFTMPQGDFGLIAVLKDRALRFKRPTKKSELLRAGLQALAALSQTELKLALDTLTPLKTGRPKNPV